MTTKEKKHELVTLVDEKYDMRRPLKHRLEMQWDLNRLAYQGYQWIDIDKAFDGDYVFVNLENQNPEAYKVMLTVNMILRTVTHIVALLTKNRPRIIVMPGTIDEDDKNRAEYTDALSTFLWQSYRMPIVLNKVFLDMVLCGTSFMKVYWDPKRGKMRQVEKEPRIVEDPTTGDVKTEPVYESVKSGDLAMEAVSARNIILDPLAEELVDAMWVLHHYIKPIDYLEMRYPQFKGEFEEDSSIFDRTFESTIASLSTIYDIPAGEVKERGAVVKELYMKPTPDYPKGLYVKVAGGKLLEQYDLDEYDWPFVDFHFIKNAGYFWGETVITHLLQIQRAFNKNLSQLVEYADTFMNGAWINPKGSGVPNSSLNNAPNVIVNPNDWESRPRKEMPPQMPEGLLVLGNQFINSFEEVSRISKASKGINPPGVRAEVALATLQEADNIQLLPTATGIEDSMSLVFRRSIKIVKENFTPDRKIAIVGENKIVQVKAFEKDWIIDDDIRIELGSMLPQSKYAQEQKIMDMFKLGIVGPEDKETALESLDLGQFANFRKDAEIIEQEIEGEHQMILEGKLPEVKIWQDHAGHLKKHYIFGASTSFKRVAKDVVGQAVDKESGKPYEITKERLLEMLITFHKKAQFDQMKEAMAMQAALMPQPAPGQPAQQGGQNAV